MVINPTTLGFNSASPRIMHVDINSCFATIEQQANPLYRGKPLVVAAYAKPFGCILAASVEAKRLGIKTGMRVKEGTAVYPRLIVLEPDPEKYRHVHRALKRILQSYTDKVIPKSIDEFCLDFNDCPYVASMPETAQTIKRRIKTGIGDHLTVSIGVGTNRFLAKTGAGLHKPDGFDMITAANIQAIFRQLALTDICGINTRFALRLQEVGIFTASEFLNAPLYQLKSAFKSIVATYWYIRLHGFEIDVFDSSRKTYGNSYILPSPASIPDGVAPVMAKLIHKMSERLRTAGYRARGIHLYVRSPNGESWHRGMREPHTMAAMTEFYPRFYHLLKEIPFRTAKGIAVTSFDLSPKNDLQLELFTDVTQPVRVAQAMDTINDRWGDYTLTTARSLPAKDNVPDRIAFGGIRELKFDEHIT